MGKKSKNNKQMPTEQTNEQTIKNENVIGLLKADYFVRKHIAVMRGDNEGLFVEKDKPDLITMPVTESHKHNAGLIRFYQKCATLPLGYDIHKMTAARSILMHIGSQQLINIYKGNGLYTKEQLEDEYFKYILDCTESNITEEYIENFFSD